MFDAHCHLDAMAYRGDRVPDAEFVAEVMTAARAAGVTRVITVGDSVAASRWCVQAAEVHPDVYAAVAVHPTEPWPVVAARLAGLQLVNLGLGGSALLDPFTARAMRDTPADLISVKIGINLVNTDLMRLRAFTPAVHGFLDTIREGHPTTPLLVVTPLLCPIHEHTPGPAAPDAGAGWPAPDGWSSVFTGTDHHTAAAGP